jgi:hypothetical protein
MKFRRPSGDPNGLVVVFVLYSNWTKIRTCWRADVRHRRGFGPLRAHVTTSLVFAAAVQFRVVARHCAGTYIVTDVASAPTIARFWHRPDTLSFSKDTTRRKQLTYQLALLFNSVLNQQLNNSEGRNGWESSLRMTYRMLNTIRRQERVVDIRVGHVPDATSIVRCMISCALICFVFIGYEFQVTPPFENMFQIVFCFYIWHFAGDFQSYLFSVYFLAPPSRCAQI